MKMLLCAASALALAGCATTQDCPPAGVKLVTQTVTKTVQAPCAVKIPARPASVVAAPTDDALALLVRYKMVLEQWGGSGDSYAAEAEAAIRACQRAGS